jgi:hypothetical protein
MSAGSSMKINSLPAKSVFCKNLTKKESQQLFSIFSIVGTLNGLIWWNKKKFEYFHLTWDSRFLQADAINTVIACQMSFSVCVKITKYSIAVQTQTRYSIHWKRRVHFTLSLSRAKNYKD